MDHSTEILRQIELRKDSIFSNIDIEKSVENEIEKGVLDDLSYSEDMKFIKTGKEIKEKLIGLKLTIEQSINNNIEKRVELLKDINSIPDEEPWVNEDYKMNIGEIPLRFSYNKTQDNNPTFTNVLTVENKPENSDHKDCMYKYNELVSQYISLKQDLYKIGLIDKNLDDKKQIKLNLRNLSALGF